MSVQFGIWRWNATAAHPEIMPGTDQLLSWYAPDRGAHYVSGGLRVSYYALHTTAESRREMQPYITSAGAVIAWDGRLDNREELVQALGNRVSKDVTDVEIVGASFDAWGTGCFARFIGDWAVSIWSGRDRLLILARDFMGIRPLYYLLEPGGVCWSSLIEPLLNIYRKRLGGSGSHSAPTHEMKPGIIQKSFVGICSVPPCSFVSLRSPPWEHTITKYWAFDSRRRVVYPADADYEEHFKRLFRQAVRRRLRSDRPIACDVNGGSNSSAIAGMAGLIAASEPGMPEVKLLPPREDWEEERHPTATCIASPANKITGATGRLLSYTQTSSPGMGKRQVEFLQSNGIHVVLACTGGSETMGGVSPIPELQDLIVRCDLRKLAHQLKLWAITEQQPWFYILAGALVGFLPSMFVPARKHSGGVSARIRFLGAPPTFQANLMVLEALRSRIETTPPSADLPYEVRYPFLDRTLLEFIFAIPREQLLRPGRRGSLLRRTLADMVYPLNLQHIA
jgi:asparagine synthase (glutamine-hydrolysing)